MQLTLQKNIGELFLSAWIVLFGGSFGFDIAGLQEGGICVSTLAAVLRLQVLF